MLHSILFGKIVSSITRALNLGSGSTWPGHLVLENDPKFIRKIFKKNPKLKVILIAGTNGKTTTTKALAHVLNSQSYSTLENSSGANLINGLVSLLVTNSSLTGKIAAEVLLFEVDENTLPLVLHEIPNPVGIILLNLFRDQLDRYGEINTIAENWKIELEKLTDRTLVIANADDPLIAYIAAFSRRKVFFSVNDDFKKGKELSHAVDSITCPKCNSRLLYSKISYSHLGNYSCINCSFKNPESVTLEFKTTLLGIYNQYNLTSVLLCAKELFQIKPVASSDSLTSFKPAFGRQETIEVDGKKIMLLLSKNPTGFNESLKVIVENKSTSLLILLNDRIPDGRDISWIWDVDFEILQKLNLHIFVSGDRAYDMANRLLFAGVSHEITENFETGYNDALKATNKNQTLTILPTYSAMLEVRKLVSGRKIL